MIKWEIGCSGFYYKHWRGLFYPDRFPQTKWFYFYCEHFNSLELNVTFYRFPELSMVEGWYKKSPEDFRFAVKAPRLVTHYKQFIDTTSLLNEFYDIIETGLKQKLGCVLYQLPPRTKYTEAQLDKIMDALSDQNLQRGNNVPKVLEFRHDSWWNNDVYKRLKENNISFCGQSHPLLPDDLLQNTPITYYRFHGVPQLYQSEYTEDFLEEKYLQIKKHRGTKEAFLFFNNDIDGSAIVNAKQMQQLAGIKKLSVK